MRPPECDSCANETDLLVEAKARNVTKNVKLFNIEQDPFEKHELSESHPEVTQVDPKVLSTLYEKSRTTRSTFLFIEVQSLV